MKFRIHHDPGAGAGLVALIEAAWGPTGAMLLSDMCRMAAGIAGADIVSIYAIEADGLVMRGNHGFPRTAVDQVRLRPGEGITGFVADNGKPVTVDAATTDTRNKPIDGLGEENFPVFLGVPVTADGARVGVLVLQRRSAKNFSSPEVTLAMALAAPFAIALERWARAGELGAASRLSGLSVSRGLALGNASVFSTMSSLSRVATDSHDAEVPARLLGATGELRDALERLEAQVAGLSGALSMARLALSDQRFLNHLEQRVTEDGMVAGLNRVARDYARQSNDRARDVEDLCFLLYARASKKSSLRPGNVLCAPRLSWPVLLAAHDGGAGALVTETAPDPLMAPLAAGLGIPAVGGVANLSMKVHPGDLLAVDGAAGTVEVGPPATTVVAYRQKAS